MKAVPTAKYAIFSAKGPQPQTVVSVWKHVWSSSLTRTYATDFDRYRGPDDVQVHIGAR